MYLGTYVLELNMFEFEWILHIPHFKNNGIIYRCLFSYYFHLNTIITVFTSIPSILACSPLFILTTQR